MLFTYVIYEIYLFLPHSYGMMPGGKCTLHFNTEVHWFNAHPVPILLGIYYYNNPKAVKRKN